MVSVSVMWGRLVAWEFCTWLWERVVGQIDAMSDREEEREGPTLQGLPPLGLRPVAPMPLVGVKGGVMGLLLLLLLPPWGIFEVAREGTREPRRASGQLLDTLFSGVGNELMGDYLRRHYRR